MGYGGWGGGDGEGGGIRWVGGWVGGGLKDNNLSFAFFHIFSYFSYFHIFHIFKIFRFSPIKLLHGVISPY